MRKSDTLLFSLNKAEIICIFIYYIVILISGGVFSIHTLCSLAENSSRTQIMLKTVLSSISISGMLCSLQYSKRLYKACITNRIVSEGILIERIGNVVYFLLRPFYAFAFVIVMVYALLSGMFIVSGNLDYIINEKFLYICAIISSFIGYSIGHVLDKFEIISKEKIDDINGGIS